MFLVSSLLSCLSPGRGPSFSVPVVSASLQAPGEQEMDGPALKPLSLIREASLSHIMGADCTRQAICPCDVLVLAGWDK